MAEAPQSAKILPFREIGSTGLNLQAGMAFEEFMPTLQGSNAVKVYQEMSLNNPVVGAILFVIEQMIRQVEWTIKPFSEDAKDKPAADFIQECLNDMSFSWADTLSEIVTFLTYGWCWMEVVYKYRRGEQPGPPITIPDNLKPLYVNQGIIQPAANPPVPDDDFASSKFSDGKIGWRKWSIRGQNTLVKWVWDSKGGIQAMVQQVDWPTFVEKTIPISKSLLFRTTIEKNNPEGRSLLRRAYRSWWYAKRLEEAEAIGLERDLNGYPVLKVPEGLNLWNDNDPVMSAGLSHAERFISRLRRGESEGAVLPNGWELELLSSGSRRAADIDKTITRYETRIAMTAAADFIFLGQGSTGSWALSSDKTEMFILALAGYLKQIKGVTNRHAIPPLLRFNNFDPSRPPTLEHSDIETQNLQELATYLSALTTAGAVQFPDEELSRYLRMAAKFPEPPEDQEPLPPLEGEPKTLTSEKRKWLVKSMNELREIMAAHNKNGKNGHANGNGFFLTDDREDAIILDKVFCPTGEGGGVDPGCSPEGGGGGETGELYHGTTQSAIASIKRNGLVPGKGKGLNLVGGGDPERAASVFLATSPQEARFWARNAGLSLAVQGGRGATMKGVTPVLLTIKLPKALAAKLVVDEKIKGGLRLKGKIPPQYITGYQVIKIEKQDEEDTAADDEVIIYGVVLVDEDEETEKVFCPTGEGGGIDPSCSGDSSGSTGESGGGKAYAPIREIESKISGNKTETMHLFEPGKGNSPAKLISRAKGDEEHVTIPKSMQAQAKDMNGRGVMTHNHPFPAAFSAADINVASVLNLAEMRVACTLDKVKYTFTMKRPEKGWPTSAAIEKADSQAASKLVPAAQKMVEQGKLTWDQGNFAVSHAINKAVSKKFGIDYKMYRG